MKRLIPLLLLVLLMAACKKEKVNPAQTSTFCIQSAANGANYTIKVALPDNYDAAKKYATIYVLDGKDNFDYVAVNAKKISNELGKTNALVVCIGYGNDRAVDYTPTDAKEGDGGADGFMQFIKNELVPKMEHDYSADTQRQSRTILGHSFGGLLAAYAFTNYNSVFGNYIMLSPSLWYDNEILLKLEQEHRAANQGNPQLVFMGLGELENSGRMQAPYVAFLQRLQQHYPGMKIDSNIESQLDHVGSRNPNILKGLRFYFQNKAAY